MRRSKAFILSEILMTILLQAGLILVLCMSFYLFLDFYTRTQQILTARNHAERVIQFMDDKIRNAGLGLWKCGGSDEIRASLSKIEQLSTFVEWDSSRSGYHLPISLSWFKNTLSFRPALKKPPEKLEEITGTVDGDVIVLLYAQKDMSSEPNEIVMAFNVEDGNEFSRDSNMKSGSAKLTMLDDKGKGRFNTSDFVANIKSNEFVSSNIKRWAVAEAVGFPFYIQTNVKYPIVNINFYGDRDHDLQDKIEIPKAGELMYLKFIQMFTHNVPKENNPEEYDRQFAFRELTYKGNAWDKAYNQEVGILEIYMTLDTTTNIFTLYVLAEGGDNPSGDTERPKTWPENAEPTAENWGKKISDTQDYSKYPYKVVYVARKSWKLNNIPENFRWN